MDVWRVDLYDFNYHFHTVRDWQFNTPELYNGIYSDDIGDNLHSIVAIVSEKNQYLRPQF